MNMLYEFTEAKKGTAPDQPEIVQVYSARKDGLPEIETWLDGNQIPKKKPTLTLLYQDLQGGPWVDCG
jgi:hypothetical protein